MGDVTEKKEGLQMDRQGKSGEGVLPTGVVKAICISDVRGIEKSHGGYHDSGHRG